MNYRRLTFSVLICFFASVVLSVPLEQQRNNYRSLLPSLEQRPIYEALIPASYEEDISNFKKQKRSDFFDTKRSGARGFHEGIFDQGFGGFSPLKKRGAFEGSFSEKRSPEMTSRGIDGDAFTKSNDEPLDHYGVIFKRNPEMDTNGFYGDTFNSGFGDFYPSKRVNPSKLRMAAARYLVHKRRDTPGQKPKRLMSSSNGFYGDTFSDGFGDFSTAKKRNLGSLNTFHRDTFSNGFGDFQTV